MNTEVCQIKRILKRILNLFCRRGAQLYADTSANYQNAHFKKAVWNMLVSFSNLFVNVLIVCFSFKVGKSQI